MARSAQTSESLRKRKSGGRASESGGLLSNSAVQMVALPLGLAAVLYLGWSMWRGSDSDALAADSSRAWYIDSDGNSFIVKLEIGQADITNPKTGKPAFPAELCYWTKDGKPKDEPTKVLMNQFKGVEGPTFCPDCERLVVPHNPRPMPGVDMKVPPTKAQYGAGRRH